MNRQAIERGDIQKSRESRYAAGTIAALSAALLLLAAPSSASGDDPFGFREPPPRSSDYEFEDFDENIPERFQLAVKRYGESEVSLFHRVERRDLADEIRPPSRFKTENILKYSMPVGDTGMIFRIKFPLNPRRIIKLQLRF